MTHGQTPTNDPRSTTSQPVNSHGATAATGTTATAPGDNPTVAAESAQPQPKTPKKRWPNGTNGYGSSVVYGLFMVLLGAIGLAMSFIITVEKIHLLTDSNFVPSCTIDNIMSCKSVMESPQASVFGFPNPLIGLAGFSVIITLGVLLATGARFPRWVWWGQALGLLAGLVFVHWLAFNAIYEIVALCPYCMVVWAVTMPLFVMTVVHMARDKARAKGEYYGGNHFLPLLVVLVWYAAIALLIYLQFYA
ncbi:vitamin K epoxide reductase family protein [Corynebacterium anserum]|uniref:vitamin K epoxide reductase family protein n=1 Tax=Corynebacterium anserum TaxID=2684406 RepID=UPI0021AEBEE3|nr:vitamin K epoxide reductase family protein [Corynebacterium anserum]